MQSDLTSVENALARNRESIMALPNVVGSGLSLCNGAPCIKILIRQHDAEIEQRVRSIVGQTPFRVEKVGPIEALPAE